MLLTILKILISVGINLEINEFLKFDEKIENILYKLIDSSLDSKNIFNHLNKLIDNDELLAKTIIEKFIFYSKNENLEISEKYKFKLFRYVKYLKFPYKFGSVIKNNLNEAIQNMKNNKDFNGVFLELLFLGYYSFLKDCFHQELGEFNYIIKNCIDQNDFIYNMYNLFYICEDDERVKEIFYCINHIIFRPDSIEQIENENKLENYFSTKFGFPLNESRMKDKYFLMNNKNIFSNFNNGGGTYNIYGRFKSEIEFYDRIKNFKKLGNIYVKLAKDYSKLVEEKNLIKKKLRKSKNENFDIIKKEEELTILNLYLKAAQQFLLDNCILNYSKVFFEINNLIEQKFSDDIDINLE